MNVFLLTCQQSDFCAHQLCNIRAYACVPLNVDGDSCNMCSRSRRFVFRETGAVVRQCAVTSRKHLCPNYSPVHVDPLHVRAPIPPTVPPPEQRSMYQEMIANPLFTEPECCVSGDRVFSIVCLRHCFSVSGDPADILCGEPIMDGSNHHDGATQEQLPPNSGPPRRRG